MGIIRIIVKVRVWFIPFAVFLGSLRERSIYPE